MPKTIAVLGPGELTGDVAHLTGRGDDLYKSMSSYLIQRIEKTPNVEVLYNTTVERMSGDGHLAEVEIRHHKTGEVRTLETAALFSFIGAVPRTDWLPPEIEKDAKEFVRTAQTPFSLSPPCCWRWA